ncbi:hypothetical protein HDE78_001756 [Rhodanobacter sp. K2T2]|uniref:hypothetical protein n=1 Tax=Rhodanobacter sp. K2T2 TaxID=2723085 RepID=UPI0015CC1318|nr:hypothetical protein [Rhodanobacter sp. K2T2]NYE28800.1 hypothetical protein [Rhodanobacter sp. K2T2]
MLQTDAADQAKVLQWLRFEQKPIESKTHPLECRPVTESVPAIDRKHAPDRTACAGDC